MARNLCTVEGCSRYVKAHKMCNSHYERFLSHGSPTGGRVPPGTLMKFIVEAVATNVDQCIPWPYTKFPNGYGKVRLNGRCRVASRVVCEIAHGAPQDTKKHVAAHSCGNGHLGCVNPRHIRWATHSENMADRIAHGTANRGDKSGRAKLTGRDVIEIRRRVNSGERIIDLALRFGVTPNTISMANTGKTWSCIPVEVKP